MTDVKEWADTAAGNGLGNPPDWPKENMDKSDVNNCAREMMAAIRAWYQDQSFVDLFVSTDESWTISRISDTVVRVAGPSDPSAVFPVDHRVKITASGGPTTVYGFVESKTAYAGGYIDVTVTIDASGTVPVGTDQIEVFAVQLKRAAFSNVGSASAEVPAGSDLSASISANVSSKSAALKDYGDGFQNPLDSVPLYSQLGTAAELDHGTAAGDIPKVSDLAGVLGDLAFEDFEGDVFAETSADQVIANATETDITSLTQITIPGTPDGVKKYVLDAQIQMMTVSAAKYIKLRAYVGSTGDKGDTQLLEVIDCSAGTFGSVVGIVSYEFTPAASTKIGLSIEHNDTVGTQYIKGTSNNLSWMRVREVLA